MEALALSMQRYPAVGPRVAYEATAPANQPAPSASPAEQAGTATRKVDPAELTDAATTLQERFNVQVVLATDKESGRSVVQILSQDGERVIRQMPPDGAIALAERARLGSQAGLLASLA